MHVVVKLKVCTIEESSKQYTLREPGEGGKYAPLAARSTPRAKVYDRAMSDSNVEENVHDASK